MDANMSPGGRIMAQKFLISDMQGGAALEPGYKTFRKEFYFLYDTLTDPAVLARLLQLSEPPTLLPAKIIGYKCLRAESDRAVVGGHPGSEVLGAAYEVVCQEHADLLKRLYKAKGYRIVGCLIYPEDRTGERMQGLTFRWNRDDRLLQDR